MSELELVKQIAGYGTGGLIAVLAIIIYYQGNHAAKCQQDRWAQMVKENMERHTQMHQDWMTTTERATQAINRMADILIKLETLVGVKDG